MNWLKKLRIALFVFAIVMMTGGYIVAYARGEIGGKGTVTCEAGKEYKTRWFNFTIESVKKVDKYAGYEPEKGNVLIDVVISEKCTFESPTTLGTMDFYIDAESFDEYQWPIDPIDDTMMPAEFELKPKDSVKYHMVYEVPSGVNDLKLLYEEEDEKGTTYRTFSMDIKI
ncbi:MAG: hypothetical protein LBU26_00965 [Synergistaceae bacterium]|jgi:hypothetical protein|nr:hypothetical protein [Synergistaceae bacterium]